MILGGVAVGQDAKFLDRLRIGRRVSRAAQAGGVVATIELEVDAAHLRAARTVNRRQLLGPAEGVRAVVAGDAAREAQ